MKHVTNGTNSPFDNMRRREAFDYYAAMGPPYIATARDFYSIVTTRCDFAPRVHDEYPHLLAEMFSYNIAVPNLGLRHSIAFSFMVSDILASEGWQLIKNEAASCCCNEFPKEKMPHVLHYCQRYALGKWFIGKYKLRKDFISCQSPLL